MLVRAISSIVGIGLFLGLCFGGLLPFTIGVAIIVALASWEWVGCYRRSLAIEPGEQSPPTQSRALLKLNPMLVWLGVGFPLLLCFGLLRGRVIEPFEAWLLVVPVVIFSALVVRAARTGIALGELKNWYGLIGVVYIGLLFSSFVLLRALPGRINVPPFGSEDRGAWLMLFVAICVWTSDTCAYFVGRGIGKHKLAPRLSPAKTVEGSIGGCLGAILIGAGMSHWLGLTLVQGLIVGAIAGTAGQIGDLFESALKREIGVKDFGQIMPGHGGTLDRFDSLLFVAPLAYLYLHFIAHI